MVLGFASAALDVAAAALAGGPAEDLPDFALAATAFGNSTWDLARSGNATFPVYCLQRGAERVCHAHYCYADLKDPTTFFGAI